MKTELCVVGFSERGDDDGCEIEEIVNHAVLDLPRIPCKGERMGLWLDDVWIEARVKEVYTNFKEHGNPYIKESAWGVDFMISLDECEIAERYKRE